MKSIAIAVLALTLAPAVAADANPELTRTVTELDTKMFDAYNRCDLASFESYFLPAVEFYHDKGGLMSGSQAVVDATRKFICNKVQRKLVPNTLKIYPIKDYGAIEEGEHIFCQIATGKCEGIAKFLMVWENKDGTWRMTRIVSYDHRDMSAQEKALLN